MIGTFYTAIGAGSSGRVPVVDISTNGKNHRTFFLRADGTVLVSGLLNYTCGVGEVGYINNWKPKNKFFQNQYWSYAEVPPYVHELLWDPEDPTVIEFPHSMVAHYDVFTTTGIKTSEIEKTIAKTTNAKVANTPTYVMASPEEILTNIKQVKTCNTHTLFLKDDGTVWICGKLKIFCTILAASNPYVPDAQERLLTPEERARYPIYTANTQDPASQYSLYPTQVYDSKGLKLTNVVSIEATAGGSYFVKDDGSVWGIGIVTGLGNRDVYTAEIAKNQNSLVDSIPDGVEDRDINLDKNLDGSKEVAPPVEKIYATNLLTRLRNENGDYIKNVIEVKSTGNSIFFITKENDKKVVYAGGFNNRGEFGIPATNPDYNPYSKNKTDLQYNGTLEGFSRPEYALRSMHTWCPWTASVWKDYANSPDPVTSSRSIPPEHTPWPLGTDENFRYNRTYIDGGSNNRYYSYSNNNGLTIAKSFCDILNEVPNIGVPGLSLDNVANMPVSSRKNNVRQDYCGIGYHTNKNYNSFYLSRSLFPPKFELVKTLKITDQRTFELSNNIFHETKGIYYPYFIENLTIPDKFYNLYQVATRNYTAWKDIPFRSVFDSLNVNSLFGSKYTYLSSAEFFWNERVKVERKYSNQLNPFNLSASRKATYKQNVQTYSLLPNWASLAFHDENERSGINSTFLGAIQNSPGIVNIPTVNNCLRTVYDVMVEGDKWGQNNLYTNVSGTNVYVSMLSSVVPQQNQVGYNLTRANSNASLFPKYSFDGEIGNAATQNKYYIAKNDELIFPLPSNEIYEQKTNFPIPFVFDVVEGKADTILARNYISSTLPNTEWTENKLNSTSLYSNNFQTKIGKGLTKILSDGINYKYNTPNISQLNFFKNYNVTNNLTALSSFDLGKPKASNVNKLLKNSGLNVTFGSWEYAVEEAKKTTPINWNSTEQKRSSLITQNSTILTPSSSWPSYEWQSDKQPYKNITFEAEHNVMAAWSIKQNSCIWLYSNHAEKVNAFSYDDLCSAYILSSYPLAWRKEFPADLAKVLNTPGIIRPEFFNDASFSSAYNFVTRLSTYNFLTLSEFLSTIKPEDKWGYYGDLQNARTHLDKTLSASPNQRPEFYIRGFYNLPTKLSHSFDKVVSSATGWYCNWDSFFSDVRQYMEPQWVHPYYYDYSLHALENYNQSKLIPGYGPRTTYNRNHTTWFLSGGVPRAIGTNESGQWGNNFTEGINTPIDPDTYEPLSDIVDIAITTRVSPWLNRIHNALETNLYDYKLAYGEKALQNSNSSVIIPNFDNNYYKEHANISYTPEELYRWWALASYKKGYITLSKLEEIFDDNNTTSALAMGLTMLDSPFSEAENIKLFPYTKDDKIVLNYQQNEECLVYEIVLKNKKGFVSLPTKFRNLTGCQLFSETDYDKLNASLADIGDIMNQKQQGPIPVIYQNIQQLEEKNFTVIPLISSSLGKNANQQTISWITLQENDHLFYVGNLASDTIFYRELKAAGTNIPVPYPSDEIVYTLENPVFNLDANIKTNCNIHLPLVINQQLIISNLTLTYSYYVALFNDVERITDQISVSPICWDFNFDEYPEYEYLMYINNGVFADRVDIAKSNLTSAQALRLNYWLPVSYSMNNGGHCHFGSSTYFLKKDGTVLSCGSNEQGQLGYGYKGGYGTGIGNVPFSINMSETPKFGKVPLIHSKPAYVLDPTGLKRLQNIVKIYAGYDVVYFVNNVGEVYSCGANYFGEQGTGSNAINSQTSYLPSKVLI